MSEKKWSLVKNNENNDSSSVLLAKDTISILISSKAVWHHLLKNLCVIKII